jgi:hypothetical protein
MNEQIRRQKIKEIYKQATGKDWGYDFDPILAERFAELIVQECLSLCKDAGLDDELADRGELSGYDSGFHDGTALCRLEIKKHFGIK